MTAPAPLDLTALLDDLERAHAAATPGPWAQHPSDDEYVIGDVSDDGMSYADVGDTYAFRKREGSADAALIVAAVNALPQLVAAVRGVLALAGELEANFEHGDSVHRLARNMCSRRLRAALTAALSPESVPT